MSDGEDSFGASVLTAVGHKPSKGLRKERWQIEGEKILVEEVNVGLLLPIGKLTGHVKITNYRLHFKSNEQTNAGRSVKECEISVPLGAIARIEKMGHSNVSRGEDSYGLEITCKDVRSIKFSSRQENHSRRPLFESLTKYAFPASNKLPFFAFVNDEKFVINDGWSVYDPFKEFSRMGVPNDTWRISKVNQHYTFADTYPSLLVLPAQAVKEGEEFLQKAGTFRSKSRIPALSWLHPESQVSLCRCSQPMVGMTSRRNVDDERLLRMIIDSNAQSDRLFIMDARPEVNAKVNKAKGGGFENEESYPNCQLIFLDVQNIHVMRESLRKLTNICHPRVDDKTWLSSLDDTHWLEHIKQIMTGACRVVDRIENHKTSVLVHCSDGWDRTAQLTSLSMLMLDPYYRTLRGFEVLVEKEWCSFGHKFAHRVGHGDDKHNDSERSPVFLQFIDCVYQLIEQFPTAFEFNEYFLITILDELYSCRFGTFLYNTEQQRIRECVRSKTPSLWSYINSETQHNHRYLNPLYNEHTCCDVLIPNTSLRRLKLWTAYYLRHNCFIGCMQQQDDNERLYQHIVTVRNKLRKHVDALRKEQTRQASATKQDTRHDETLTGTTAVGAVTATM